MYVRLLAAGAVCLAGCAATAPAARPAADAIADYVRAEMRAQHIPGLALLVVRDGKVTRAEGYGLANLEDEAPVTPETLFQSGSVGKQFTAMAVMILAEEGKLDLEDPITRFFPEAPAAWAEIKVKHLLSHSGGFGDYPEDLDKRRDYTEAQLIDMIKAVPLLAFKPGAGWHYSNLGYVLLGILIHRASGQLHGDFLREHVFTPLGMKTARVISEADIIPHRAAGYRAPQGQLQHQKWVAPTLNTTADGSLLFSLRDLERWDAGLAAGRLLTPASYARMWTPFKLADGSDNPRHYGFGWSIREVNGHRVIEHRGAWQGFTTNISRYVDDKLTVVVLTNQGGADPDIITHHLAGLIIPALRQSETVTQR